MKELFYKLGTQTAITIAMLLLVLSPFQALLAQAQTSDTNCTGSNASTCIPSGSAAAAPSATPNTAAAVTTGATATTPGVGVDNTNIGCNLSTLIGNTSGTFAVCLTNIVYVFTVGIGSGFAYVAAYFFDLATQISLNGTAYALTFISTGWTTARDLANMAFLFILLFIAFQILLSAETSGTMSLLAGVIVVALLVNFSFFFTRIVIDAGNIVSIEFYNSIQAPSLASTASAAGVTNIPATVAAATQFVSGNPGNTKDLTANIMGMLQLQNLFGTNSFKAFFNGGQTTNASGQTTQTGGAGFLVTLIALTFLYIAAGIMFWLISVMFVTVGAKFLIRVVVLWFLIIASPLALVARAVPQLRKYFTQWRDLLVSHAFYPVMFMFIFLILTNFANQMSCTTNGVAVPNCTGLINDIFNSLSVANNSSSAVATIGYAVANVGIRLGFVLIILYLGIKAADSVSVMGAKGAEKAGNWVGTGLLKAYNVGYKRAGPGAWSGALDRSLQKGKLASLGNNMFGYELRRYVTKPLAGTTIPASHGESFVKMKERQGKETIEKADNLRDVDNKEEVKKVAAKIAENIAAKKPADDGLTAEQKGRVQNLTKREFEAMSAAQIEAIAPMLKEGQIKLLEGIAKLTDSNRDAIKKAWKGEITAGIERKVGAAKAALAAPGATPGSVPDVEKKKVQSLGENDMKNMSVVDLKRLIVLFTEDQKKKVDNLDIPQQDKDDIKNKWDEEAVEAPFQKSVRRLREISAANGDAAYKISTLGPTDMINTTVSQEIKNILQRENGVASSKNRRASQEYAIKAAALEAARTAPAGTVTAAALATAQAEHDAAEAAASTAYADMQAGLDLVNKHREFEDNLKKIEPNAHINSNGTKGTFKAGLI